MSEPPPLRLIWPQWQGAGPDTVGELTPELPFPASQLGYHLGSRILELIAPATDGVTVTVPTAVSTDGLSSQDGVYARDVLTRQLRLALDTLALHQPSRIVTLGGECSVSVAPFSYLADRYRDDLAVVWVDAHPDVGTPASEYDGYHAMAVSHLIGRGDPEFQRLLPSTLPVSHVALAGLHAWEPDQEPAVTGWGLAASPRTIWRTIRARSWTGSVDWGCRTSRCIWTWT